MAEETAAVAPTTTTETAAPLPNAAPTLAEVKAARRTTKPAAAAKPNAEPAPGVETGDVRPPAAAVPPAVAKPPEAKPPETAKIDMDPAALSQFTELNKAVRETKTKLKEAETKLAEFAKIEKARGLSKEGKEYDAIREAGFDVDKALAELLAQNPGQQPSADLIALKREIDDLKTKAANQEKQRTEQTEAQKEASIKNDRAITGRVVTESASKYVHLAKAPELVDAAFKDFTDSRAKLETDAGRPLPSDEQAKLLLAALDVH